MTESITVQYEAELHYPADEVEELDLTEDGAIETMIEMVMNNADVGTMTVIRGKSDE